MSQPTLYDIAIAVQEIPAYGPVFELASAICFLNGDISTDLKWVENFQLENWRVQIVESQCQLLLQDLVKLKANPNDQ